MDTSILLARLIGPLFVVVSIGVFLNQNHYAKMAKGFLENAELYYFSGAIAFVIGTVIITFHNLWVTDWRVVITVIGWLSLIKGIIRILFPKAVVNYATEFTGSRVTVYVMAFILLICGGWLSYKGYQF